MNREVSAYSSAASSELRKLHCIQTCMAMCRVPKENERAVGFRKKAPGRLRLLESVWYKVSGHIRKMNFQNVYFLRNGKIADEEKPWPR